MVLHSDIVGIMQDSETDKQKSTAAANISDCVMFICTTCACTRLISLDFCPYSAKKLSLQRTSRERARRSVGGGTEVQQHQIYLMAQGACTLLLLLLEFPFYCSLFGSCNHILQPDVKFTSCRVQSPVRHHQKHTHTCPTKAFPQVCTLQLGPCVNVIHLLADCLTFSTVCAYFPSFLGCQVKSCGGATHAFLQKFREKKPLAQMFTM